MLEKYYNRKTIKLVKTEQAIAIINPWVKL